MSSALSPLVPTTLQRPRRCMLDTAAMVKRSSQWTPIGGGANGVVARTAMTTPDKQVVEVACKTTRRADAGVIREIAAVAMMKVIQDRCMVAPERRRTVGVPYCVCIRTNGETGGLSAEIVMAAGERSLAAEMETNSLPADAGPTAILMRDVWDAAEQLEHMRMTHRDVKPANVVIGRGPDGRMHATLVDMGSATPAAGGRSRFPPATTDPVGISTMVYAAPVAGPFTAGGTQYTSAHGHDLWAFCLTMLHTTGNLACVHNIDPRMYRTPRNPHKEANKGSLDPGSHAHYSAAQICLFGGIDTTRPYEDALRETAQAILTCFVDLRVRTALASVFHDAPGAPARLSAVCTQTYVAARGMVPEDHVEAVGTVPGIRVPPAAKLKALYTAGTQALVDDYTALRNTLCT